jgi:peptidoglycan/xylan/chitin deacetylase (PgdA/CDA1 family)
MSTSMPVASSRPAARLTLALLVCGAAACEGSAAREPKGPLASASWAAVPARSPPPAAVRGQLDGRAFPDKVLALTWDDGPDVNTLALASYLARERVSATFFVVREWSGGLSADPGSGDRAFETGYAYLPILGDLVQLGHRVGNHTLNHVLLSEVKPEIADQELKVNQEDIDPFLTNELRIFRAPGGAWSARSSRATDADPYLVDLVGPIRWDIDRKDWESSLDCGSSRPAADCEPAGPHHRSRVRPEVVARRYLSSIESAGHGVVLFHDRVGDVGSSYALEVAEHVIPALVARGFVFVAPVLGFVEAGPRLAATGEDVGPGPAPRAILQLGDLDGDGRADACIHAPGDRRCSLSVELPGTEEDRRPRTVFESAGPPRADSCAALFESEDIQLADVDGDGHADVCATLGFGVACAIETASGSCAPARKWSLWSPAMGERSGQSVRFGDLDGDGKVDLCTPTQRGIACAKSTGRSFGREEVWAPTFYDAARAAPEAKASLALADIDGDGRADVCAWSQSEVACARSTGHAFGPVEIWSRDVALTDVDDLVFGDLNGDGRADVCGLAETGVECALSTGRGFTRPSTWLAPDASPDAARLVRSRSLALGDVNGDHRADLCGYDAAGVVCALAP